MIGHNTDIVGFDKAIKALDFNMKDKKILILGAGGVVPSIVLLLKKWVFWKLLLAIEPNKKQKI